MLKVTQLEGHRTSIHTQAARLIRSVGTMDRTLGEGGVIWGRPVGQADQDYKYEPGMALSEEDQTRCFLVF